jgi:nucleotide-binding universal stress UspA family protein
MATIEDRPAPGQRVVAGIDGTPASEATVRTAVVEAHRRSLPLHLVWAVPGPPSARIGTTRPDAGERHVERLRALAAGALPDVPVTCELVMGSPGRVLVSRSRTAALVVLRAPHSPAAGVRTAGSLTMDAVGEVTRHAWCPVLVDRPRTGAPWPDGAGLRGVHGGRAEDTGGVVVGVDGGPSTTELVTVAAEEAARRGTGLLVVHARPVRTAARLPLNRVGGGHQPPETAPPGQEAGQERVAETIARIRDSHAGSSVELRVVEGQPASALVGVAAGADLLVVGRPHRTGLLPRTTQAALSRATAPVLVVPVGAAFPAAPGRPAGPEDPATPEDPDSVRVAAEAASRR